MTSVALALVLVGCGGGGSPGTDDTKEDDGNGGTTEGDAAASSNPVRSGGSTGTTPSDAGASTVACTAEAAPAGVVESPLAFAVLKGSDKPPQPTGGGTIVGTWRSEKVTVYVPESAQLLLDPAKSKGTVKAWARFDGKNYRLTFDANLTLQTLGGAQSDTLNQFDVGAYTATGADLKFTSICPTTDAGGGFPGATFTVNGSKAQILSKITTQAGDLYLLLDAVKL
ncbi:MAG: hypothetical protein U0169_12790 [Polyangiaceae bacterium]